MMKLKILVVSAWLSAVQSWSVSSNRPLRMGLVGGVNSIAKRARDSLLSKERSREELKIGIAGFYDRSSKLWESVWGEHMHHGYYVPEDRTDHVQAQIDLIDQVLKWAEVQSATNMVDVGCGIGGSSRHIARKLGCTAQGITLSPYQAQRGNELAQEQRLREQTNFQVADALDMPFADNSFDLVWSLESGEHMPDKTQFVNELLRVATPGGRIIVVTWCHRDLEEGETSLTKREERLLAKINRAYYLPKWCSVNDYVDLLKSKGAIDIKRDDWSYIIAPFWKAVIRSSLNFRSVWGLLRSGFSTQRGAYAMILMLRGFNKGLIKFGLITCKKPEN
uniref:Methyltransferase type 11 domain-containing protein n=1 Tax=Cyclophora tenuis TaxID=216820 RepID=A0A7S1GSA1_CYCTE|mmetsp:Transcript_9657/g.16122  ORF Transcript_9657/g.16122 Transcript_9657/m.16122 type:complete len:335 (+) Transcript_9657:17-1021(+)